MSTVKEGFERVYIPRDLLEVYNFIRWAMVTKRLALHFCLMPRLYSESVRG